MTYANVEDLMRGVGTALETDAERSRGISASYVFHVSGPGGGTWSVVASDGAGSVRNGAMDGADTTIDLADDTLLKLGNGELDGGEAFMEGLIQVQGDMSKAIFLAQIIQA